MATVPMLCVRNAERAIEFYKEAFGAREVGERIPYEGKVGHAEIEIAGGRIMLADEFPEHNRSPETLGGTPVMIHVDVEDVDGVFRRAAAAGAKALRPPEEQPYGRLCKLEDPFGHIWFFMKPSTKI